MRLPSFLIIISVYIFSCNSNSLSEDSKDIDLYWLADSIVHFNFDITDQKSEYNLFFYVRNGANFPHSNLYFKFFLKKNKGEILESELINLQLFNEKSGYPLGSGVGNIYEHQYELLVHYTFDEFGTYDLSFQQYMRYDSLPEIYSIGYRVEKTPSQ